MQILVKSWQDLRTILAKSLTRSCHGIHFAMFRSYQESHVHKKNFIVNSYWARIWPISLSQTSEELLAFSSEFRKPEYVIVILILCTFLHANSFQQVEAF